MAPLGARIHAGIYRLCGLRSSHRVPLMWPASIHWHDRFGDGQTQTAIVRYVEHQGDGFLIGLEFAEPCVLQRGVMEEIDLALTGMTW